MEREKVFRSRLFIKRRLQWKIFAAIIIILFSFTFFLGLSFYLPLLSILYSNLPPESDVFQQAAHLFLEVEKYIWLLILVVIFLIGFYSVIFFQKIVGPIYRFERALQEMSQGDLSRRIQLRRHDELHEVGAQFNQTLAFLEEQIHKAKRMVEETEKVQATLLALCQAQFPQNREIELNLSAVDAAISKLHEALSIFKLSTSAKSATSPK